jgi:hypothetical protein
MGGLGSLTSAIEEILLDYGIHVPTWAGVALALLLIATFLPNIIKNARVDKARRDMGRLQDLSPEDRDRERERILDMANDNPVGLVAIADEALRKHQTRIARGAVERLRRTGKRTADLRRLERTLDGDKPRHLLGEVIAIEHLLKGGAREAAAKRLAAALETWPDAPELHALQASLDPGPPTEVEKS